MCPNAARGPCSALPCGGTSFGRFGFGFSQDRLPPAPSGSGRLSARTADGTLAAACGSECMCGARRRPSGGAPCLHRCRCLHALPVPQAARRTFPTPLDGGHGPACDPSGTESETNSFSSLCYLHSICSRTRAQPRAVPAAGHSRPPLLGGGGAGAASGLIPVPSRLPARGGAGPPAYVAFPCVSAVQLLRLSCPSPPLVSSFSLEVYGVKNSACLALETLLWKGAENVCIPATAPDWRTLGVVRILLFFIFLLLWWVCTYLTLNNNNKPKYKPSPVSGRRCPRSRERHTEVYGNVSPKSLHAAVSPLQTCKAGSRPSEKCFLP